MIRYSNITATHISEFGKMYVKLETFEQNNEKMGQKKELCMMERKIK